MSPKNRRNLNVVIGLVGVVAFMVGLTFASVPLYRLFCQVTGFDGTPLRAEGGQGPKQVLDRVVTVSFTGDVNGGMPWSFYPKQTKIEAKVGQTYLAFFEAKNNSDKPITGTATFNVSPEPWGPYFVKIECFCFTEQTLQPGQSIEMPVTFYLDPALDQDKNLKWMSDVTLSYTFFKAADQSPAKVGAVEAAPKPSVN